MGPVPETFLKASLQSVDYWMSRFVLEARRQDGKLYPPNTLHSIVLAVQRHYVEHHNRPDLNMMLKENAAFQGFRQTLDGKMKELHAAGFGVVKGSDAITDQDEKKLWDSNVINLDTAQGLSYAAFYYVAKAFGLRGKAEHCQLMADQFVFGANKRRSFHFQPF